MFLRQKILIICLAFFLVGPNLYANSTLKISLGSEPGSLNPLLATDLVSANILHQLFEGLMTKDKDGKTALGLAESYVISDDGTVYTFKIRDNAKWSNGEYVKAQDIEYSWKWMLTKSNGAPFASQFFGLNLLNARAVYDGEMPITELGIRAIDSKTIEIRLSAPSPLFLDGLTLWGYLPINQKVTSENPSWASSAGPEFVGNGPYMLKEWKIQDRIVLEKNPYYWDADLVNLDEIILYTDSGTKENAFNLFMLNDLDIVGGPFAGEIPNAEIESMQKQGIYHVSPSAGIYLIRLNTSRKPFDNLNFRKALAYSINRDLIVKYVTEKGEIPARSIIPPVIFTKSGELFEDDNELAKEYLEEALKELGYKDISEIPQIDYAYNTSDLHKNIAQAVQDMWKKSLGFEVYIDNLEWKVLLQRVNDSKDFDLARASLFSDQGIDFLERLGRDLDYDKSFDDFRELLVQYRKEIDVDKRLDLLKQAEKIAIDRVMVIPVYFYVSSYLLKPNVKGMYISPLDIAYLKQVYLSN